MIENYNEYQKLKFNIPLYMELSKDLLGIADKHFGIERDEDKTFLSCIMEKYEWYVEQELVIFENNKYKSTCLYRKWYYEKEYFEWIKFENSIKNLINKIKTKDNIFINFNYEILELQRYYKLMHRSKTIRSRKRNKEMYIICCMAFIQHCDSYFGYSEHQKNTLDALFFKSFYRFFK